MRFSRGACVLGLVLDDNGSVHGAVQNPHVEV